MVNCVSLCYIINGFIWSLGKTGSVPLSAATNTIHVIAIRQQSSTTIVVHDNNELRTLKTGNIYHALSWLSILVRYGIGELRNLSVLAEIWTNFFFLLLVLLTVLGTG